MLVMLHAEWTVYENQLIDISDEPIDLQHSTQWISALMMHSMNRWMTIPLLTQTTWLTETQKDPNLVHVINALKTNTALDKAQLLQKQYYDEWR